MQKSSFRDVFLIVAAIVFGVGIALFALSSDKTAPAASQTMQQPMAQPAATQTLPVANTPPAPAKKTTEVKTIEWRIEPANPAVTEGYQRDEQRISAIVTFADNRTETYGLGTAYGCTGSTATSVEGGKRIVGKVNCYYALSGVGFTAYTQNGQFVIDRGVESAKDGSVQTTVIIKV